MKKNLLIVIVLFAVISIGNAQNVVLYGMTSSGGQNEAGVMFKYNATTSTYTKMYDFVGANPYGGEPNGSLCYTTTGFLYGLCSTAGMYANGSMFNYCLSTSS